MAGPWFLLVGMCVGGLASWLMFRTNIDRLNEELAEARRKNNS